jgi:transposase
MPKIHRVQLTEGERSQLHELVQNRTARDFAWCLKALVDVYFPDAEIIRVVLDNLSAHKPAALYEVFPPEQARRILRKLEFHWTPKHGSWLNPVETEISVLSRQCLNRRIPDIPPLQREVASWEASRNDARITVDWRFTTVDARRKLQRLYPLKSD